MHEPLAQLLERTYSAAEREVIYRLIRGGGQVRHFAADPIPHEALRRIHDAALDVPCIEEMPPWPLILVTSPALRAHITAAVEGGRERDASTRPNGLARDGPGLSPANAWRKPRCTSPSPTTAAAAGLWGSTER